MNVLYVCTLSQLNGTLAAAGASVPLQPPTHWMGEPVIGAWAETGEGEIAIKWGRVPRRIAGRQTLMEQFQQQMGPVS
ncbi:hypothetical protein [Novispirillum itersonii]|uniref:Uncharacterized protein n=1 Tax=Novispirillum itersonii TaxID=189 RepID=A0A7X0DPH0_NOVIT|nr:hypothetical protein [Novispirillum itersonii]MBB6211262.1 hypothetical protein [Novispirillum itersonii]